VSLDERLDIGEDAGTPVVKNYEVPFRFTGRIDKVTVDIKPESGAVADAPARPPGTRID